MKRGMILVLAVVWIMAVMQNGKVLAAVTQNTCEQTSINVSWTPVNVSSYYRIDNYKIYLRKYADPSSAAVLYQTLPSTQTSAVIAGLAPGTRYYVQVKYNQINTRTGSSYEYSAGSLIAGTAPGDITGLRQDRWYYFILSFTAAWDKQDAADGYEYICRTSKNQIKKHDTITGGYSASASVNGIKNEMIYTFQVRAFKNFNGAVLYGNWSAPIYCFTQPRVTSAKTSGNKLKVSWKKVVGATGYEVYASTKEKTGYKRVAKVSAGKNYVTVNKLGGKKIKKGKKYYVYVVTLKKVNGRTSNSGRLYYWSTKKPASSFGYF